MWICVTNKGVRDVNIRAISQLVPPITEADLKSRGYPTDPKSVGMAILSDARALLYVSHGTSTRSVVS